MFPGKKGARALVIVFIHIGFALGEPVRKRALEHARGHGALHFDAPAHLLQTGTQRFLVQFVLDDVIVHIGVHSAAHVLKIVVGREQDDVRVGADARHLVRQMDAIHQRHGDV